MSVHSLQSSAMANSVTESPSFQQKVKRVLVYTVRFD